MSYSRQIFWDDQSHNLLWPPHVVDRARRNVRWRRLLARATRKQNITMVGRITLAMSKHHIRLTGK